MIGYFMSGFVILLILIILSGLKTIRPTEKGLVERFGKYIGTKEQGLTWIIPFGVDRLTRVNVTEQMVDIEPQTVITKDKLNAIVDAVVYYKVDDVYASLYKVNNHKRQLASLARTTLRSVVGKMTLTEANGNRAKINEQVEEVLDKETDTYGVNILRVELQKIQAPKDVQEAMNQVVKAEQEKIAAIDRATARETEADGVKKAKIKEAEGSRQFQILEAEGKAEEIKSIANANAMQIKALANAHAEKIKVINESIQKHFKDKAIDYKKLETAERALANGTKYIVDTDKDISLVLSDAAGITPVRKRK